MTTMKKFQLFIHRAERTEIASEVNEQMARLEAMVKFSRIMIERIRCAAQPNKHHRTERLAPKKETAERLLLVAAIRDGIEEIKGPFNDNPTIIAYLKSVADVEEEVFRNEDKYLRQVQLFTVNELKKFADQTYVTIQEAFSELQTRVAAYDYARDRLRKCAPVPEEVKKKGEEAAKCQKSFEEQAVLLRSMLERIPDLQVELARAICMYLRAEGEYGRLLYATLKRIPPPVLAKKSTSPAAPPAAVIRPPVIDTLMNQTMSESTMSQSSAATSLYIPLQNKPPTSSQTSQPPAPSTPVKTPTSPATIKPPAPLTILKTATPPATVKPPTPPPGPPIRKP